MKRLLTNKSQKTRERIEAVMFDIRSYRHNIALLDGYAEGRLTLKGKNYSEYAANYKRTAEDNKRYLWTRKHLKYQVSLLEKELQTLIDGA